MAKDIKFKLTTESKVNVFGVKLFRIEALVDIWTANVKKGDKGGWLSSAELDNGNARVSGNAWVSGNAEVYGDARVSGNAWVYGDARVSGNAWVSGDAEVYGNARVSGNARVYGEIKILSGYLFGMRYNKEEIKYLENEGQEIIYKGELELGKDETAAEEEKVESEIIELNGKKYRLIEEDK
jgi:hypothetical protein